jgi:DNA protecting protein DprA
MDDLFAHLDEPSEHSSYDSQQETPELGKPEWLWALKSIDGIGDTKAISIAREFRTIDNLQRQDSSYIKKFLKGLDVDFSRLKPSMLRHHSGVSIASYFDPMYPIGFKDLTAPPAVIWYRGELNHTSSTAVVGTRNATEWGMRRAYEVGAEAAELGFGVISGLAMGIDAAAHSGALSSVEGYTVAILGGGVSNPSPASNINLANLILDRGGCLLAEVPPQQAVTPHSLVQRNRLQAALAKSLIVVESGVPSGTLKTVKFAVELNRRIGVCKPEEFTASSDGNRIMLDPQGIDPMIFGGTRKFLDEVRNREPFADSTIETLSDLKIFLNQA